MFNSFKPGFLEKIAKIDGFVKSLFTGHCEERSDEAIS